jgi:hypothetical protein
MTPTSTAQTRSQANEIPGVCLGASERARRAAMASHAHNRRRRVDPTTCDREYSAAELEFMGAMQAYKMRSGRMFPTWGEVLDVLMELGYKKPASTPILVAFHP